MTIVRPMAVILLDDAVKEILESGVRLLGAGINSNARIDVLAAREDACLERDASVVLLVVILIPNIFCQVLAEKGLAVSRELWPTDQVIRRLKVRANLGAALVRRLNESVSGRVVATHL